ncbi:hypothetical protein EV586_102613 [Tumebacillus sp. BK434]|uniref:hypothetical protein n=1 Tax=Tumebacillus sp. BK434 TaxID=2512169 RepID=UPI0010516ABC|nr:hypothetical protein [Tumebacillus sp. BK434]TCP58161.1 hypothetical protein EV586_102613 [Tumebacillus sp. BK434]
MKKVFFLLLASFAFCLTLAVPAEATIKSDAPQNVIDFAAAQLPQVKQNFYEDPVAWGFRDAAEIDRATLGLGMQVHYWQGEELREEPSWEFVIEADGKPRTFLTVSDLDGSLKIIAAGGHAETFQYTITAFQRMAPNAAAVLVKDKNNRHLLGTVDGKQVLFPHRDPSATGGGATPLYVMKHPAPTAYVLADTAVLALCGSLFILRLTKRRLKK